MKQSFFSRNLFLVLSFSSLVRSQNRYCYLTSTLIHEYLGTSFGTIVFTGSNDPTTPSPSTSPATLSNVPGFGSLTSFWGSSAEQSLESVQSSNLSGVPIGRTTTSSISSTTASAIGATGSANLFNIYVNINTAPPRLWKRVIMYVAFNGSDGVLVSSQSDAALFELVNGYLMSGGEFLGADSASGYSAFKKSPEPPAHSQGWSSGGGEITFGNATFCAADDGSFYILLTSSPSFFCGEIALAAVSAPDISTITTASEMTSSIATSSSPEIMTTLISTAAVPTTAENLSMTAETVESPSSTTATAGYPANSMLSSVQSTTSTSKASIASTVLMTSQLVATAPSATSPHTSFAVPAPSGSSKPLSLALSSTPVPSSSAESLMTTSAGAQNGLSTAMQTTSTVTASVTSTRAPKNSSSTAQPSTSTSWSTTLGQATTSVNPTIASQHSTALLSSGGTAQSSSTFTFLSSTFINVSIFTTSAKSSASIITSSLSTSASQMVTKTATTTISTTSASSAPSITPGVPVRNNGKRGLAYTNVTQTKFYSLSGQNSQVSWSYDYYSLPNTSDNVGAINPALTYVPLLYNDANSLTSIWAANVNYSIANYGTDSILAFNEPDGCDGGKSACMSVAASVAGYQNFIQPFAGRVFLGAPAVTNAGAPASLTYLSYFLGNCTECQIDFIPIHWYASPYSFSYLQSYVQRAYAVGGNRPLWITEFGMDSQNYLDADVQRFLKNATTWLDAQSYVKRYAWFGDFEEYLLNADGTTLSAQGVIWNNYTGGYVH